MRKTIENDRIRLQHMLDAARHALEFADGQSRDSLGEDLQFQFALAHAYFKIDLDVLWKTTIEDLPSLIEQLEAVLPNENASE